MTGPLWCLWFFGSVTKYNQGLTQHLFFCMQRLYHSKVTKQLLDLLSHSQPPNHRRYVTANCRFLSQLLPSLLITSGFAYFAHKVVMTQCCSLRNFKPLHQLNKTFEPSGFGSLFIFITQANDLNFK